MHPRLRAPANAFIRGKFWLCHSLVGPCVLLAFLALPSRVLAVPIFIDFEGLTDVQDGAPDPFTIPFSGNLPVAGVMFSNSGALIEGGAGGDLNEFDFPPRSPVTVATDVGAPIRITFSGTAISFEGYFTYVTQLTLEAFNAANVSLGSVTSAFNNNINNPAFADPGSAPNELLSFAAAGIKSVVITGDPGGGSFVVDDVTADVAPSTPIPEPATLFLVTLGAAAIIRRRLVRKSA